MSRIKEVICICCPCGCHLQVDPENDYNVTGNACPNGAAYGREELTHPTRILTSTVRAGGAGRCVRHRRGRCGDAKSVIHTPETIRR